MARSLLVRPLLLLLLLLLASAFTPPTIDAAPTETEAHGTFSGPVQIPLDTPESITRAVECVRRNLRLDSRGLPTARAAEMRGALPLLITPLSADTEARFFTSFACSINVPIRYHYIVHNGRGGAEVAALVAALREALGDSQRLIVRRNPTPLGCAESLNQGLRWGMEQRGIAEVPYAATANVDVWFGPEILGKMIRTADAQAEADAPLLAALQAEVEQEQRWAAEGNLTYYHTYAPPGRPLVVLREGAPGVPSTVRTSRLLPDRLRYMYKAVNYPDDTIPASAPPRPFQDRLGILYPVPGENSFIIYTRLLLSTAGFLDENFFPAYYEDIDIWHRAVALGFKSAHTMPRSDEHYMHIGGVSQQTLTPAHRVVEGGERGGYKQYLEVSRRVSYEYFKYGRRSPRALKSLSTASPQAYTHTFFDVPFFPPDVWVADARARECYEERRYNERARKWWDDSPVCIYNLGTIVRAGVMGEAQLQSAMQEGNRPLGREFWLSAFL